MATCKRIDIKPEPPPCQYVLTLSAQEAGYLVWLLNTNWSDTSKQIKAALMSANEEWS